MPDYSPAASVPPPQGPALPPDWHLICCDEDHGSPSRIDHAPNNGDRQQQRSDSTMAGQSAGNFVWMSCCEDEACVSPPVDDNRQQSYNFATGGQTSTNSTGRNRASCSYTDTNAQDCCGPTASSGANTKGLTYCAQPECPAETICCESIHSGVGIAPIGRHGPAGSAPMDCTDEGCCDLDEFVCQDHDMVGACVSLLFSVQVNLRSRKNGLGRRTSTAILTY